MNMHLESKGSATPTKRSSAQNCSINMINARKKRRMQTSAGSAELGGKRSYTYVPKTSLKS